MGQRKGTKLNVQKEKMVEIFVKMLETNKAILEFQLTLLTKEEHIKNIKKIIKKTTKAIEIIKGISHYEILVSLYNSFVNKRETYFIALYGTIMSKKIQHWDKTKKGFKEFLEEEKKAIEQFDNEMEEKRKTQEIIKKAKEEGKKVELMYIDGKIKPVVVNEKPN